jgi:hypothetical protein
MLESIELKVQDSLTLPERNQWLTFHTFVVVCYTLPLRGCEGFLLDLAGLNRQFAAGGSRDVVAALLGKIKGESDDRAHLLPCVPLFSLGINIRALLGCLNEIKKDQGHVDRPAISDVNGRMMSHQALNK